jgi:hypothetical protein
MSVHRVAMCMWYVYFILIINVIKIVSTLQKICISEEYTAQNCTAKYFEIISLNIYWINLWMGVGYTIIYINFTIMLFFKHTEFILYLF